ncbi:hypothetical protein HCH54_008775 [Aspergillus fumigatus]
MPIKWVDRSVLISRILKSTYDLQLSGSRILSGEDSKRLPSCQPKQDNGDGKPDGRQRERTSKTGCTKVRIRHCTCSSAEVKDGFQTFVRWRTPVLEFKESDGFNTPLGGSYMWIVTLPHPWDWWSKFIRPSFRAVYCVGFRDAALMR